VSLTPHESGSLWSHPQGHWAYVWDGELHVPMGLVGAKLQILMLYIYIKIKKIKIKIR
jgi:hypothetical protein